MAYDEGLAERMRKVLHAERGVTEKKMFGGVAFLSRGYMFVGISGDALMARVGPDYHEAALGRRHVREMDFTGRPMKGYVFVDAPAIAKDADLAEWIERCHAFVKSLPPKKKKKK